MAGETDEKASRWRSFWMVFARTFSICLSALLIVLYGLGWGDLIANGEVEVTGIQSIIRALPESFVYFVMILPYWWAVLLGLPLILAVVISSVAIVVKMLWRGPQSNHSAA